MRALIYDTETTGLPLWHDPSDDQRQPHIVQLAAILVDLERQKTMASLDLIVRPDGWTIPEEVAQIHGIGNECAERWGILEETALSAFLSLWHRADVRIAHNESFDARIIRIAMKRHLSDGPADLHEAWKSGTAECTQKLATPILQIPATDKMVRAGFGHRYKSANLQEAYQHFYQVPFEGAHTAMADVQACAAVYYAIQGAKVNG